MEESRRIGLIALDLDGTLLNSDKKISRGDYDALERAAAAGVYVVPTTGRYYDAMPEAVRSLPFVRYAIVINGAQIVDTADMSTLYRAEIPREEALGFMEFLDTLPVFYDCYLDGRGWMTASMQQKAVTVVDDIHYKKMIKDLRTPVPELKAFVRERGVDVQKVQFFIGDPELRSRLLRELPEQYPDLLFTSSLSSNIEVNAKKASKGKGIHRLAEILGLEYSQTMALGDGLNDVSMIIDAGVGVSMANGCPEAKAAADYITLDNDSDGVAAAVEKFVFGR